MKRRQRQLQHQQEEFSNSSSTTCELNTKINDLVDDSEHFFGIKSNENCHPLSLRRSKRCSNRPQTRWSARMHSLFSSPAKKSPWKWHGKVVKVLNQDPPIYMIHDFLTESEILHLDQLKEVHKSPSSFVKSNGKPKNGAVFTKSYTQDIDGISVISEHRTSQFVYLKKFSDPKVRAIESRAADFVGLPIENVEPLQIVRYEKGQQFGLHHDCGELLDDDSVRCDSDGAAMRLVTLFVYLNTMKEGSGGATFFPNLGFNNRGLSVRPERACAVLWANTDPNGTADPRMVHMAMPVLASDHKKFGMNIWISAHSMMDYALSDSGIVLSTRAASPSKKKRLPQV